MSFASPLRRIFLSSTLAAWLIFLASTVMLQYLGGAYKADLIGYPDESAHYVTALAVRDYIAQGLPESPMRFAENYYLHLPKVALGWWPPFFYLVSAAWMLVFSTSRVSVIFLSAVLSSLIPVVIYRVLRNGYPRWAAFLGGLLFTLLPSVQQPASSVMADLLVALLCFLAALSFARFAEVPGVSSAAVFGLLTAVAILTKGNSFCLFALPPLALLLQRRIAHLKRPSFYVAPLIIVALAGPWYATAMVVPALGGKAGLDFAQRAFRFYGAFIVQALGVTLFMFVVLGVWARIIRPFFAGTVNAAWASAFSLGLSCFLFHCVVTVPPDSRYLLTVVPVLIMFLVAGVSFAAELIPLGRLSTPHKLGALAAVLTVAFGIEVMRVPRKYAYGYQQVASDILSRPELSNSVILVSSERDGEGALIAEVAMRESRRPQHVVLRATKMLAQDDWMGRSYRLIYTTPDEIQHYLDRIPVGVLVLETTKAKHQYAHHEMLQSIGQQHPDRWNLAKTYLSQPPVVPSPVEICVYSRIDGARKEKGVIEIDLPRLKRTLRTTCCSD